MATLSQYATVIRSKNAGPFELTFDIMFDNREAYETVRRSGVITARLVAQLYGISDNEVLVCRAYNPALSFKITIRDRGVADTAALARSRVRVTGDGWQGILKVPFLLTCNLTGQTIECENVSILLSGWS